jgi:hypothetical protein
MARSCEHGNEPSGSVEILDFREGWESINFSRETALCKRTVLLTLLSTELPIQTTKLVLSYKPLAEQWRRVSVYFYFAVKCHL